MDCLPNMQGPTLMVSNNDTVAVATQVRTALGPSVSILILEGHDYTKNWVRANQATVQRDVAAVQPRAMAALASQCVRNLHYPSYGGKLGGDARVAHESTGGIGVHPTSLAHITSASLWRRSCRSCRMMGSSWP
jgi:hypothetical protein